MIKRIGFIITSYQLVEENIEDISKAFSKIGFVPLHTESLYYLEQLKQVGYSPLFRKLNDGETIPEYKLKITKDDKGKIINIKVEEELIK
jgi:hypothetical protein